MYVQWSTVRECLYIYFLCYRSGLLLLLYDVFPLQYSPTHISSFFFVLPSKVTLPLCRTSMGFLLFFFFLSVPGNRFVCSTSTTKNSTNYFFLSFSLFLFTGRKVFEFSLKKKNEKKTQQEMVEITRTTCSVGVGTHRVKMTCVFFFSRIFFPFHFQFIGMEGNCEVLERLPLCLYV